MNSPTYIPAAGEPMSAQGGSSPYATGGGGVSFAQRVAVTYLESMLTGSRRVEMQEFPVASISFQTGPSHPVDDLLLVAGDREVELAIACRATPHFVPSDLATVKLVKSLLSEMTEHPQVYVAVAVAGWKAEWEQVNKLCDIARTNSDVDAFQNAMESDGRWLNDVRKRLAFLHKMVAAASDDELNEAQTKHLTWTLLTRLRILGFKLQSPNEADWTALATSLDSIAASDGGGAEVRDRLAVLAAGYDSMGGVVDLNLLRSQTHLLIDAPTTRTRQPAEVLEQYRTIARSAVRGALGPDTEGSVPLSLPFTQRRSDLADQIRKVASGQNALVVSGSSGTGKSSLVLSTLSDLETGEPGVFESIILNFRELPDTAAELQHVLGAPLGQVMAELSAPNRVLVIDAADAAAERSSGLLRDILIAAANAKVGVVAVAADPASQFVREQVEVNCHQRAVTFEVGPLGDDELAQVAQQFPLLRALLHGLAATSLLRRLVVLDLLSRTGLELNASMSEWECLDVIWRQVVRGDGRPTGGSPQAREEVLVRLAAAALTGSAAPDGAFDAEAVDALRKDHLLAPANLYSPWPQFSHDEVRRYATAIHLIRSGQIVDTLRTAGIPRWALSAVTLACKGHLVDPTRRAEVSFQRLVTSFKEVATTHGSRWADVPIEAVLETPAAFTCLKSAIESTALELQLADVLRVVQQRVSFDGFVHPVLGAPVVRYLIDHEEPWHISKQAFEVLTSWLQSLVLASEPHGHGLRQTLRERLFAHWSQFPREEITEDGIPGLVPARRRRVLNYRLTDDEFVEVLALLGPDTDTRIESCLRTLADEEPAFLAPAVDLPYSAMGLAQYNPELLATLLEAYYIDKEEGSRWSRLNDGIRAHQGRWAGLGSPLAAHYLGGFAQLFRTAKLTTSARVLNRILNHAARIRVDAPARPHRPVDTLESSAEPAGIDDSQDQSFGITLNLTGASGMYFGDGAVWSWYRGTSVGPYPCISALQAMERLAERLLEAGVGGDLIAEYLLRDCENLAIPGLLYGLCVRNLEKTSTLLDSFLKEPAIWQLEFSRVTGEFSGLKGSSEGLAHPERRQWTPREVCIWLMTHGDDERRLELRGIGEQLVANGVQQGTTAERVLNWAANLDESRYQVTKDGEKFYLNIVPPPEVIAAQEELAAQESHVQTVLRLQNRYWGSRVSPDSYVPPSASEVANDLTEARLLLQAKEHHSHMPPHDALAHLVRTALGLAAEGKPEALGDEGAFAIEFVVAVASAFLESEDQSGEGQYFELGADRAVAEALPALLTSPIASELANTGVTTTDVTRLGLALADKAPLETRLFLARGCDKLWVSPCGGAECIHRNAISWAIESARRAEIGPWDPDSQRRARIRIDGDFITRLKELDGESISIDVLDPAIRALGFAAATENCARNDAKELLVSLLEAQRRAMVQQEGKGWQVDHRGAHTLVAARTLLQSFAADNNVLPLLEHLDGLQSDASLFSNFLHGLAASGAENTVLAEAACKAWPHLLNHALSYKDDMLTVYQERTWGSWAAAALLPDPLSWTQGMHNELAGRPIDWVNPNQLVSSVDDWLAVGKGESRCVDALVKFLKRLPDAEQALRGIGWLAELCIQDERVVVEQSWLLNSWLKDIRTAAEDHGVLSEWQAFVDALVVAGNTGLAPFST